MFDFSLGGDVMRSVSFWVAVSERSVHFNFEIIPFCFSDLRKKLKLVFHSLK